ncbi:bacterial transcriptional activator domain-containing protein [Pararhizobium sp. DWP1-1-3]|uniref:bacterial transcriptional activator domain-containing protein n=1 Tax=Pararhizobium sp. DWP1-1-3 TaxID=2804652 RepID=UPI003CE6E923
MIIMKKYWVALLAASSLLMPAMASSEDSARLLTQAAGSFRILDEAASGGPADVEPSPAGTARAATAVTADNQPDEVEMAALYYYAGQKQDERVAAEAARLRLKFPQFEMPQDLYLPQSARGADETVLWQLYDKSDFTGIDAEIIRRKTEAPDWQPTADFTEKLARRKQRVLMTEAAKDNNWTDIIQAGGSIDPATETEIDLLWMLIDAYAQAGMKQPLADVYRGILLREGDKRLPDAELVTTSQKAIRDFPAADVQAAMQKLAVTPAMQAGLQPVAFDLMRKTVADFNADEKRTVPLTDDQLEPLKTANPAKIEDMALLGWYYLKIKQPAVSAGWFGKALAIQPDAPNAKGLYLSLAAQNLEEEAYKVATTYLQDLSGDPEFLMNALSLRFAKPDMAAIDEKIVASYSTTILQTLNADHAEILAWYAYNSKQYEASAAWFQKTVDWKAAPARVKGLALSYLRLSQKAEFAALQEKYGSAYPDIWDEIRVASPPKGRVAAAVVKPRGVIRANYFRNFQAKRYAACINDLADLRSRGQLSPDAAQIGGWCYLGLGRLAEARAAFADGLAAGGQVQADAAYGTALTLLRGRLTDDAEAIIRAYPLSAARDREIRVEIYFQRARASFDRKQYQKTLDALNARASLVAEPADLSQLRGWAYYHLGNKQVAKQVFQRLNDHLSDAGVRAGLVATSQTDTRR